MRFIDPPTIIPPSLIYPLALSHHVSGLFIGISRNKVLLCRILAQGGGDLKRDMEVVRKILTTIAESDRKSFDGSFDIPNADREKIEYHLQIMKDAGILDGTLMHAEDKLLYHSLMITWTGNDFYETFKDDSRWEGFKEWLSDKGEKVSGIPFDILIDLGKVYIKSKLGLD